MWRNARQRLGRILRGQALVRDPQARAPAAQASRRARRGPLRRSRKTQTTSRARSTTLIDQKSRAFARMGVEDLFAAARLPRNSSRDVRDDPGMRDAHPCQPARRRHDYGRDQPRPDVPRLLLSDSVELSTMGNCRASARDARICNELLRTCDRTRLCAASISPSATSPTSATGPIPSSGCTTIWRRSRAGGWLVGDDAAFRRTKRLIKQISDPVGRIQQGTRARRSGRRPLTRRGSQSADSGRSPHASLCSRDKVSLDPACSARNCPAQTRGAAMTKT